MCWCATCGFTLDSPGGNCPHCRVAVSEAEDSEWTVVARFNNAAEAGFFACELSEHLQIEPRILERELLDPFTHAWSTNYILMVTAQDANRAVAVLKNVLELTGEDPSSEAPLAAAQRSPQFESRFDRERLPSGINWVPIVLTLTAGTFVLWSARKPPAGPPAPPNLDDLWKSLTMHPDPWVQHGPNGGEVRQMIVDPVRQQVILRQDLDGDGKFEAQEVILQQAGPAH